ncbi:unnamed protein product, partial [Iphiclides podalirius]
MRKRRRHRAGGDGIGGVARSRLEAAASGSVAIIAQQLCVSYAQRNSNWDNNRTSLVSAVVRLRQRTRLIWRRRRRERDKMTDSDLCSSTRNTFNNPSFILVLPLLTFRVKAAPPRTAGGVGAPLLNVLTIDRAALRSARGGCWTPLLPADTINMSPTAESESITRLVTDSQGI